MNRNREQEALLRGPFEVMDETRERRPNRSDLLTGRNIVLPPDKIAGTDLTERRLLRTSTPQS